MRWISILAAGPLLGLATGCTTEAVLAPGPASVGSENPAGRLPKMVLRDGEGRRYDALGRGRDGAGALIPLAGYNQFWFAWSVFNHDSAIFPEGRVDTGPLTGDGECAVPCDEIRLGCPGPDCIPALTAPSVVAAGDPAAAYLSPRAWVVGVAAGGEARAYPHNVLWWHEIVNDVVGGVPVAITHCPLTFSSIGHDPTAFTDGKTVALGVSGRLFNANLVFYSREDESWFSQLLGVGTRGTALGVAAPRTHVWEMSWAAWRTLYPRTTVLTEDTGHARNYQRYPYGDYFTDHDDTFSTLEPRADARYPAKTLTYGLRVGDGAKAYPHPELRTAAGGEASGIINDAIGSTPVAILYDLDAGFVQAFAREGHGELRIE
ncbi:MAG: DUF3179 domain-containing protein [Myxococcota bacterium]